MGVERIIASEAGAALPSKERLLLCGAIGLCLLSPAIHLITCTLGSHRRRKIFAAYRAASAGFILVLAIAGANLSPLGAIALVAAACAVQVAIGLWEGDRSEAEVKC